MFMLNSFFRFASLFQAGYSGHGRHRGRACGTTLVMIRQCDSFV
jgi:hypothetical protein